MSLPPWYKAYKETSTRLSVGTISIGVANLKTWVTVFNPNLPGGGVKPIAAPPPSPARATVTLVSIPPAPIPSTTSAAKTDSTVGSGSSAGPGTVGTGAKVGFFAASGPGADATVGGGPIGTGTTVDGGPIGTGATVGGGPIGTGATIEDPTSIESDIPFGQGVDSDTSIGQGVTVGDLIPLGPTQSTGAPITITLYRVPANFTGQGGIEAGGPLPIGWGATMEEYVWDITDIKAAEFKKRFIIKLDTPADIGPFDLKAGIKYFVVIKLRKGVLRSDLTLIEAVDA